MKLFDTHAHLNFPDYELDYREVWERAKGAGLVGLVNVGTDLATSKRAIEQAHELDAWASVGIHPHDTGQFAQDNDWKRLIEAMIHDERVVAIGEVGFDYFRQGFDSDQQEHLLEYFLALAEKYNKPVIFHCRPSDGSTDAYEDLLAVIGGHRGIMGVVHAYGGDRATAQAILDKGLYLSFTAQATYPKNQELYAALFKIVPLDRVMLETDCPFLSPEGLRGQRNEPRHVDAVAIAIGRLTSIDPAIVARQTTQNALQFFSIRP